MSDLLWRATWLVLLTFVVSDQWFTYQTKQSRWSHFLLLFYVTIWTYSVIVLAVLKSAQDLGTKT